MIRHARLHPAPAVFLLPVGMIEPAFRALLVTAVGASMLMETCLAATCLAAVALSAITARTEKERGAAIAAQANSKPQNHFARNRHASPPAGLDKNDDFVPR